MILLTTLFVFGLFLLFTGIDVYERDAINQFKGSYVVAGGTGTSVTLDGGSFGQTITNAVKQKKIDKYAATIAKDNEHLDENGEPAPTEGDIHAAEHKFWADFYHHKFEDHPARPPRLRHQRPPPRLGRPPHRVPRRSPHQHRERIRPSHGPHARPLRRRCPRHRARR
jgi:hypothetical protein